MQIKTDYWIRFEPTRAEVQALNTTELAIKALASLLNKDMYVHALKNQHTFSYDDIQTTLQLLNALSGASQLQIDTEKGE